MPQSHAGSRDTQGKESSININAQNCVSGDTHAARLVCQNGLRVGGVLLPQGVGVGVKNNGLLSGATVVNNIINDHVISLSDIQAGIIMIDPGADAPVTLPAPGVIIGAAATFPCNAVGDTVDFCIMNCATSGVTNESIVLVNSGNLQLLGPQTLEPNNNGIFRIIATNISTPAGVCIRIM